MSLNNNNNGAWNKIEQTHDLFKKIIAPLKQHLGINFGYMIVFNDGRYYQIIEDLDCLKAWVTNVETSHIFCARNVTTYFDQPYNFTIWPEEPTCPAMEIYKEYGMWNGITVSKVNKDYTELYWFTKQNAENNWHKWFIRSKPFYLQFIDNFKKYTSDLFVLNNQAQRLFKFEQKFNHNILKSEYTDETRLVFNKVMHHLKLKYISTEYSSTIAKLSPRELEVLESICCGYTTKIISRKLDISVNTTKCYIDRIKHKTGLHYKTELIELYEFYAAKT